MNIFLNHELEQLHNPLACDPRFLGCAVSIMVTLLDLASDLLLKVYTACLDVPAAINLSGTNRHMYGFWLDNSYEVVMRILSRTIDAFNGALELSVQEMQHTPGQSVSQSQADASPPSIPHISTLVPKLVGNASLAASAVEGYHASVAGRPAHNYRRSLQLTSLVRAYYLVRKLVSADKTGNAQATHTSRAALESLPDADLKTALEISDFLPSFANDEESERQGIAKGYEAEWTIDDELVELPANDQWDNACDLIVRVSAERCL